MKFRVLKWLLLLTLTLSVWCGASAAFSAEVEMKVTAIYASRENKIIDDRLKDLADTLAKRFGYTSYKVEAEQIHTRRFGQKADVALPGMRPLTLQPRGKEPSGQIRINLQIPDLLMTDLLFKSGHHILIGGPLYKKGVLILLIRATEK